MHRIFTARTGAAMTAALILLSACSPGSPTAANTPDTGSTPYRGGTPGAPPAGYVSAAHYVSPAGSDANAGTEAAPWRTLASAFAKLYPGDTLYLRGGTYTENVQPAIRPGRADARIIVRAYPGERPVLAGLLWLSRPSYWTLDGLNVTWNPSNSAGSHMVKMVNGTGWVLENAELWGAHSFAALLVYGSLTGEPAGWTVRNNCVHDTYSSNNTSQDQNLYINTGTTAGAGLIERNVIFGAPNGMNVKLGYGRTTPEPGDGTANVTVRYNTMYGALKNLMVTDESHDNLIERNLVIESASNYFLRSYRLSGSANVFRNNVFYGASQLQYADPGYQPVTDGGGNLFPLDPQFGAMGCGAFRPASATAQAYGRYAP